MGVCFCIGGINKSVLGSAAATVAGAHEEEKEDFFSEKTK